MKKLISMASAAGLSASLLAGCAANRAQSVIMADNSATADNSVTVGNSTMADNSITADSSAAADGSAVEALAGSKIQTAVPKYIFLFIGDGMSYPQIESTNYYLSALENDISMGSVQEQTVLRKSEDALSFLDFPVTGSAQTYDSTSFCPDSASTATSMSTGYKTYSGTINMDETGSVRYETITEKLHDQLGYKIGVISTVNLNHATPDIGKVIIIDEHLADSSVMRYEIDSSGGEWALKDYVSKGIECLSAENDKGFFMMVEDGKIDWACYANDAASMMTDTKALSDAVEAASAFYAAHPDETLILVTGDYETGGLTINQALALPATATRDFLSLSLQRAQDRSSLWDITTIRRFTKSWQCLQG